jgi:hypothetical protein
MLAQMPAHPPISGVKPAQSPRALRGRIQLGFFRAHVWNQVVGQQRVELVARLLDVAMVEPSLAQSCNAIGEALGEPGVIAGTERAREGSAHQAPPRASTITSVT